MTGPSCAELIENAERHARNVLVGTRHEMIPIVHLVKADGESIVIGTPWADDEQKEITLTMLAALMREGEVIRYSVMCEAWMRVATDEEAAKYKPGEPLPIIPPIRDHPERVEIVVAAAVERGGKVSRVWGTVRDASGVVTDLVVLSESLDSGPWLNLLPMDA